MCGAPSKWCLRDITDVSRDLCDDCVPPEDCMSIDAWAKLTDQEKEELRDKLDGTNKEVSPCVCARVVKLQVLLLRLCIVLIVTYLSLFYLPTVDSRPFVAPRCTLHRPRTARAVKLSRSRTTATR
jgi:hypothetical protein